MEIELDGQHIVIACTLSFGDAHIQTRALIDCGASGFSFVDDEFTRRHRIPLTLLPEPRPLEVIDGRPIASGDITHLATATLAIQDHQEELPLFVTKLGHYPVVLGIPWLRHHDVVIRWATDQLTFDSDQCLSNCLPPDRTTPLTVHGMEAPANVPPKPRERTEKRLLAETPPPAGAFPSPATTVSAYETASQTEQPQDKQGTPTGPPYCFVDGRHSRTAPPEQLSDAFSWPTRIGLVGAASFVRRAKKEKLSIFSLSLYEINKALDREKIKDVDLKTAIPAEYHEFLPLFDKVAARELPPHRPYDHRIPLK